MNSLKTYIACDTLVISMFIEKFCNQYDIDTTVNKDNNKIYDEVVNTKPNIIFLTKNIIELNEDNLIQKIKSNNEINPFIVLVITRGNENENYFGLGIDQFLPVPFTKFQMEFIIRRVKHKLNHILFVGSFSNDQKLLLKKLESEEFLTQTVESGNYALVKAKQTFPDLIICNASTDDIDAAEFTFKIKQNFFIRYIPIVILLNDNNLEFVDKCFNSGAQDLYIPPFDDDQIIHSIKRILSYTNSFDRKTVLIVEDSFIIRTFIGNMFKHLGFNIHYAENGSIGLEKAQSILPDLITCDFMMPIMNGWDFCKKLKEDTLTSDIPVIIISSMKNENDIDRKKFDLLGIKNYLPKPFKIQELNKEIHKAFDDAGKKIEESIIKKYVSSDAIKNVTKMVNSKSLKAEEKFISILFSDICAFTTKFEKYSAKQIVRLLNDYIGLMADILHHYDAIIDKLIGDAIVVRFDSGDRVNDALNAAKSSIEMLKALKEFNKNNFDEIKIRIGVNSGKVILGNIGSEKFRLDYTMIGDPVNIAQRLEKQSIVQGCLISESTYSLIKDFVKVDNEQSLVLKGKAKTIKAYNLLSINKYF